ncbi:MAG: DUF3179 domain-containing protein [Actinobacteria bacterium]|nr:DUF3179 domain-containing protein [Actinomycetota bacterium]
MVHRREIDGAEVVLGNQGDLYKRAMTWWDHDTGSVWSQPSGEAILGPRKGQRLELLPSTLTTWGAWTAEHPETLALDAGGGPTSFALDDMLIVVDLERGEPVGVPYLDLQEVTVVNVEVADTPVAVVLDPTTGSWAALSRQLPDGRIVELQAREGGLHAGDGLRWTALGRPLGGQAPPLQPLPSFTSFPRDFAAHFPGSRIVRG